MFSSLKLKSFKCQSYDSSDNKKDKAGKEGDEDDVSDHMYEKLPSFDNRSCNCHLNNPKRSPKPLKTHLNKRISKWRMECPGISNHRNAHSDSERDSKNNQEGRIRETLNLEQFEKVKTKVITVTIERDDGNLGITLRGGFHQNSNLSRPVIITYVKPDGPAAREGTIKPGDRLLAVDGVSLKGSNLNEAQTLLRQQSATTLLTIEYDVIVVDKVKESNIPLLVEIERTSTEQLGLTLYQNEEGVIIERVKPGSLADRSGALNIGDLILAINATRIDGTSISLEQVMKILECECPLVRLEILPSYAVLCNSNYSTWRSKGQARAFNSTFSGGGTLRSSGGCKNSNEEKVLHEERTVDCQAKTSKSQGFLGTDIALTHCETLHTTITRENGSFGVQFVDAPDGRVLINTIALDSAAERNQCLHPGDRVLSINHRSIGLDNLSAKDINNLLELKSDEISCSKLSLHTEFDVLDAVVPSSGIFMVKLVKRGCAGLGITMTASKSTGFVICELKKGSIAYRAGSLVPGDRILAINNIPLDQCTVEYAAHVLHQATNIVTLKVHREECNSEFRSCRKITYTVDLQRYGGPLGITIAGSEEPFHPITVSGLTTGGLAEQTGVIQIGDEILAINNHSLYGEALSAAHSLLQNSSDLVSLKLSRSIVQSSSFPNNRSPILPSSIDSAVESWNSSHQDLTSSPDHQKSSRDSHDDEQRSNTVQQQQPLDSEVTKTKTTTNSAQTTNIDQNSDLAILDEITSENLKIKRELDLLSMKLEGQRNSKIVQNDDSCSTSGTSGRPCSPQKKIGVKTLETVVTTPSIIMCPVKSDVVDDLYREVCFKNKESRVVEDIDRESYITNDFEKFEMACMVETKNWCKNQFLGNENNQDSIRSEFQTSHLYEVTLFKDPIYEDFGFSVSDGLYERGVFINRIRKGGPADISNILKPYDRILQVNNTYTQDFDCCLTVPLIASAGDSLTLLVARNPDNNTFENGCYVSEKVYSKGKNLKGSKTTTNNRDELKRILV